VTGPFSVPVAAFGFAHGGPRVDTPPPQLGRDNDAILAELGYDDAARAKLRASGAI
jgi:crotonobetainyl-CoA:carnitine CoA-transferase CaiB-like acyl-CoA transferase